MGKSLTLQAKCHCSEPKAKLNSACLVCVLQLQWVMEKRNYFQKRNSVVLKLCSHANSRPLSLQACSVVSTCMKISSTIRVLLMTATSHGPCGHKH